MSPGVRWHRWPAITVGVLLLVVLSWAPLRRHQLEQRAKEEARLRLDQAERALAALPAVLAGEADRQVEDALLTDPPTRPDQGRALVQALGSERLLDARHLAPLIVAWYAGRDLASLDDAELALLAASTARLLGSDEGADTSTADFTVQSLAGLSRFRDALAARCPGCAPPPSVLPPIGTPAGIPPSIQGERIARSSVPEGESSGTLGSLVGAIRRGQAVSPYVWDRTGACGMAALELARAGQGDQLEPILRAAVHGPTAMDRLAALHAAMRLAPPSDWPPSEARERGMALDYELGAGTR